MNHVRGCLMVCGLILGAGSAFATPDLPDQNTFKELVVIEDRGGESIANYLPRHKAGNATGAVGSEVDRRSKNLLNGHFPVVTTLMSPGRVTAKDGANIRYQLAVRPMFIVGHDPVSIKWIQDNRKLLSRNNAIGLVVNVETEAQMEELQSIAGSGVMLQPTPGDRLSKQLGITHYPFYVDQNGVMRQ